MSKKERRGAPDRLRRLLMLALAAVFVVSVGGYLFSRLSAQREREVYTDSAQRYTARTETAASPQRQETERPPITVDFDALRAVNDDVVGWIYCEGTTINYPVVYGETNDVYLRRDYEGNANTAGSIFIEAQNRADLSDANTILYGHNMADGSMFAALQSWRDQAFYDAHPVLWLLTPERDYRLVVFSGYPTSAYSEAYSIFTGPSDALEEYVERAAAQSVFDAPVERGADARYVLLSTCASAYGADEARYVLHAVLEPLPE